MTKKLIFFLVSSFIACSGRVSAAIDKAEWKKCYSDPRIRAVTERWLTPGPELEKQVREEKSKAGTLPKDPVSAEEYIKQYVAFYVNFFSTVYRDAEIDSKLASQVLASPLFDEIAKQDASLLLYVDSGDVAYLKQYFQNSGSGQVFLRARDPAVAKIVLEIVAEGYRERLLSTNGPPGENATIVAKRWPTLGGLMYFQPGGDVRVARQLFRDRQLFVGVAGVQGMFAPIEGAKVLHELGTGRALEEFLYPFYQNGDWHSLAAIKMNAKPELAEIVDEVGERYRNDIQNGIARVRAAKATARPVPPAQPGVRKQ